MRALIILLMATAASSCAPPGKVLTASQDGIDFNAIKSITLNKNLSTITAGDISPGQVYQNTALYFEKKGIAISDTAAYELVIKLYDQFKSQQVQTTFIPEYPRAEKYTEGTISGRLQLESNHRVEFLEEWCILSLVDKSQKKIIWEGGYVAMRDETSPPFHRHKQILHSLEYLIKRYPD